MPAHTASGTFDIVQTPSAEPPAPAAAVTLEKTFHGDLEGTGAGRMLAFRTATPGSAGYVAIERVTGTLAGREGSFVLQHSGILDRGTATLTVAVIPDSATGALAGLTGAMTISQADGRHRYEFRYDLPAAS